MGSPRGLRSGDVSPLRPGEAQLGGGAARRDPAVGGYIQSGSAMKGKDWRATSQRSTYWRVQPFWSTSRSEPNRCLQHSKGQKRGSVAPTSSGPSKAPTRAPSLGATDGEGETKFPRGRAAAGNRLQEHSGPRTLPCPKPLRPAWEAAGASPGRNVAGASRRGGGSGLLPGALSDSWPRREDCQRRYFVVDGKERGGRRLEVAGLRQQLRWGGFAAFHSPQ